MSDDEVFADKRLQRIEAHLAALGIPDGGTIAQVSAAAVAHAVAVNTDPNGRPWVPHGARNIGGRVKAMVQHPTDPRTIYASSAYGGLFRTTDAGDTWEPLGQPEDAIPGGALAIAPSNPNRLYIASGEQLMGSGVGPAGLGFFRFDAVAGTLTREVAPMPVAGPGPNGASQTYGAIAVDPDNAERCWIAGDTGLWRREVGPIFLQDLPGGLGPVVTDVVAVRDPAQRTRLLLYVGVSGDGVYSASFTAAGGFVWGARLATTAAAGTMRRIRLAVCTRRPQRIYALMENAAGNAYLPLEVTDNSGALWAARAVPGDLGTFPWWCSLVVAHPDNPEVVIIGGVQLYRSLDAGLNWTRVVNWSLAYQGQYAQHADQHAGFFDWSAPEVFWLGNDGGISRAADMIDGNPALDGSWRKRSHGILCGQFNDITVHPTYPQMLGGGLQDNGTFGGYGGGTWYHIGFGDGGEMAWTAGDPRRWYAPSQGGVFVGAIQPASFVPLPPPGGAPGASVATWAWRLINFVNADHPDQPAHVVRLTFVVLAGNSPFKGLVKSHPVTATHLIAGRQGSASFSTNGGTATTAMPLVLGGAWITTLSYAPPVAGVAPNAHRNDWWVGTGDGRVFRLSGATSAAHAPAGAPGFTQLQHPIIPPGPARQRLTISAIAIHPADPQYIAVATAGDPGNRIAQGRVYLSRDRGRNWTDITVTGAPPGNFLPPCPFTSIVFDPQPAAAAAQVLYLGTMAGVYVCRNLPRRQPGGALPVFAPVWQAWNNRAGTGPDRRGRLPLTLVTDLEIAENRLYAATFGRGIYQCDLTVAAQQPAHRLFIRQHLIEDGAPARYPRPTPATLNTAPAVAQPARWGGDPRYPAGTMLFTDHEALDIRVDNAPFQFHDRVVDGVEFDIELTHKPVVPGRRNIIYVQAHTAGWDHFTGANEVRVHLFWAPTAAPAGPATAPAPNLQAGFWATVTDAAPAPPAGAWQRVGTVQRLADVGPAQPAVARFEWIPPATLGPAATHIALLALATSPADALAGAELNLPALIRAERRAAYRVVPTLPFRAAVRIREGLDDAGEPGAIQAAGRSPDIIVVKDPVADPLVAFADLYDPRLTDRVHAGTRNHVYVRVFNDAAVPVNVDVNLLWARTNVPADAAADLHAPPFDATRLLPAVPPGPIVNINIPAERWGTAHFEWDAPASAPYPTDAFRSLLLVALVRSSDGGDALPDLTRINDPDTFRRFFRTLADADNAALRAVRLAP